MFECSMQCISCSVCERLAHRKRCTARAQSAMCGTLTMTAAVVTPIASTAKVRGLQALHMLRVEPRACRCTQQVTQHRLCSCVAHLERTRKTMAFLSRDIHVAKPSSSQLPANFKVINAETMRSGAAFVVLAAGASLLPWLWDQGWPVEM